MKKAIRAATALLICCLIPMAQAKRAPNLEMKNLKGNPQKTSDLRGSIVVIDFWATWCVPCREELPMLSRLDHEYEGRHVRFIAANANAAGDRPKVDGFLSHHEIGLEVWLGADLDMLERAGMGNVLPATLILDEQGDIVARVLGQAREQDVKAPVDWLLGGKVGPAPALVTKRY
jgi:thiol-disulfide isomerase/thioredoxin